MAAVLNTNIASLWASKNLQTAQSKMADSVERLSSGLRINRARDDAAGLAIGNELTSQINASNQGIRNLNDGISMVQTTESGLAAASDMAQRILTLATQASNGSLSASSRDLIKEEMTQILSSIDGIANRTSFGGNSLLDGTTNNINIRSSMASGDSINLLASAFNGIGQTGSGGTATLIETPPEAAAEDTVSSMKVYIQTGLSQFNKATLTITDVEGDVSYELDGEAFDFDTDELALYTMTGATGGSAATLADSIEGTDGTAASFNDVIVDANDYIELIGEQRAKLGAYQNQLEYAVNQVADMAGNLSAARSRVMDTDYANETASLTKGQILQQAATAMLAQANQMPNVILSLLK
jgi:flagellin